MDLPNKAAKQILETDVLWKTDSRGSNPRLVSPELLRESVFAGQRDLHIRVSGAPKGVAAPTDAAFGPSGNTFEPAFAVGDYVYLAAHFDQDIKQGTTVTAHIHWTTNGTNANSVKWEVSQTHASIGDQFGTDDVFTLEGTPSGTAWTHYVTSTIEFPAPAKHSTTFLTFKRITNGATDNTDTVFGLFVDILHESDQYGTINGVP